MNLPEKNVLITGARGGLGWALTTEFANHGWRVIATDLKEKTVPGNKWLAHDRIWELPMDVTSAVSVNAAVGEIEKEGIHLDMIVNNAGIDGYFPLCEMPLEFFRNIFEVNVFGGYRVTQAFLPLLQKPGGRIVNISSESVKINIPFMTYPVSKQTLEAYSRTLRQEMRFLGVGVIIIRPGAINTPFLETVRNAVNPVAGSLLKEPFKKFAAQAPSNIRTPMEPSVAARRIVAAVTRKKAPKIYSLGNDWRLTLASCLPAGLFENSIFSRLEKKK
jgi:NAD(P)-dependent dehydrogenase (short-subunit alcohol dehydrogenase family)